MRSFIGLEIPEHVRNFYASSCKSLQSSAKISFSRLDKMHITLAFFADLPDMYKTNIDEILTELNREQFEIKCENIGLFKKKGIPSTVFIKIISDELKNYTEKLHDKLRDLNVPFDDRRPYTPHITIGRIHEIKNEQDFIKSYRYITKNFKPSSFLVERVHLFSSDMITHKKEVSKNFINIEVEESNNENNI